jgi:hypothetical protein
MSGTGKAVAAPKRSHRFAKACGPRARRRCARGRQRARQPCVRRNAKSAGSCLPGRNLSPSRSKVRTRPVAPCRTAAPRSTGSTPALTPIVKTSGRRDNTDDKLLCRRRNHRLTGLTNRCRDGGYSFGRGVSGSPRPRVSRPAVKGTCNQRCRYRSCHTGC